MVEIMHCLLLLKAASSPCWPADSVDIDAAHMSKKVTPKSYPQMNTADNGLLAFVRIANSGELIVRFINSSYWRPLAYVVDLGRYEVNPRVKSSVKYLVR